MIAKALFGSFFLVLLVASAVAQDTLRIVGSDLLGSVVQPLLKNAAQERGWAVEFDFQGSLLAERALKSGGADMALLALPRENPPKGEFLVLPLAFEVTRVVVNEANPIQELNVEQLRTLFSASSSAGKELTWGALGGKGSWEARQINLHAVRQRDHLNLELFRSIVLGPREMSIKVRYWTSSDEMIAAIAEDNSALGLLPVEENHPQVRSLFLALNENSQAYNANAQSVFYGDYPLRLTFYLVANRSKGERLAEVARFLFSDAAADVLKAAGYQPVPSTERRQFQMDLDVGG